VKEKETQKKRHDSGDKRRKRERELKTR